MPLCASLNQNPHQDSTAYQTQHQFPQTRSAATQLGSLTSSCLRLFMLLLCLVPARNATAAERYRLTCDEAFEAYGDSGKSMSAQSLLEAQLGYTFWWTNGSEIPPLVTTSSAGTTQANAGVLGRASTSILYGAEEVGVGLRSGGTLNAIRWLDCQRNVGLDFTYFGASSVTGSDFSSSNNANLIVARPFRNALTSAEDAQLINFPGSLAGVVDADYGSEFHSASILARFIVASDCRVRNDFAVGYRYFNFREGLALSESLTFIDPVGIVPLGTTLDLNESFALRNSFHGGELAWLSSRTIGRLQLQSHLKLAMGGIEKRLSVAGQYRTTSAGGTAVTPSGLLTQRSNIGTWIERDFSFLPEAGIRGVLPVTERAGLTVGYNVFCLTQVGRIGDSIDTNIDLSDPQVVAVPIAHIGDSTLVGHGLTLGATYSF